MPTMTSTFYNIALDYFKRASLHVNNETAATVAIGISYIETI